MHECQILILPQRRGVNKRQAKNPDILPVKVSSQNNMKPGGRQVIASNTGERLGTRGVDTLQAHIRIGRANFCLFASFVCSFGF